MEGIEELIVARGARIEYLPPYSPDFNPIEMLWSTVKSRTGLLNAVIVLIK
ncbi:MAG: transposase [Hormoscilla sp. GM102CHS1]|nr:transposase [Hormoscilla sp. GM102CHS1]